jgi:type IV pilus assembly protein PilV
MKHRQYFFADRRPAFGLAPRCTGFTLVEVMVALIVISVGLLGIAKLQAVALSSTGTAGKRSVAALEAASLASTMHADRIYWTSTALTGTSTTISGNTVASTDNALNAFVDCSVPGNQPCTPAAMVAFDLATWAQLVQPVLPNYTATITCAKAVIATSPATCTILLTWSENLVAANAQGNQAMSTPAYTLYVEP